MQQLRYRSIIGTPNNTQWFQVATNTDNTILCSLAIEGEMATILGDKLVTQIQTWQAQTALEFHQLLQGLVDQVLLKNHQLFLAGGCFVEGKCFLATFQGSVILRRHQKAGTLLSSEQQLQLIEGKTQAQDLFILATQPSEAIFTKLAQPLNQGLTVPDLEPLIDAELQTASEAGPVVMSFLTDIQQITNGSEAANSNESSAPSSTGSLLNTLPAKLQTVPQIGQNLKTRIVKFQYWLAQQKQMYFSNDIYLRRQNTKKIVRVLLPIGVIIVVAMAVFLVNQSRQTAQIQAANQALQPFETQFGQLKEGVKENPLATRTSAEQLIAQLQTLSQKFTDQPIAAAKVKATLNDVTQFYESISGQEELPALPVFFDLKPTQSDFITSDADLQNNVAVFLDREKHKVIAVNLDTKQPSPISLGDEVNPSAFIFDGKSLTMLSNGIAQFPLSDAQTVKQLRSSEDANANAKFLESFGDYLYVLNPEKNNIFRYAAASGSATLSDPVGWVRPGADLDFDAVQSMAIDGNIWLGMKDGQIKKFLSGKQEDFTLSGLKEPFSSPVTLFTKENLDNLYVLEPQKSRVVVLSKKGEFLKEVKSQSLASTNILMADEKLKKAFAVSNSLIFEIGL